MYVFLQYLFHLNLSPITSIERTEKRLWQNNRIDPEEADSSFATDTISYSLNVWYINSIPSQILKLVYQNQFLVSTMIKYLDPTTCSYGYEIYVFFTK